MRDLQWRLQPWKVNTESSVRYAFDDDDYFLFPRFYSEVSLRASSPFMRLDDSFQADLLSAMDSQLV